MRGSIKKVALLKKAVLALVLASGLTACGGGGGGSSGGGDTPTPVANNWDSMQWDNGQWQ